MEPRTQEQRRHDSLCRLETDIDVWVATADPETGSPYLIPLSFLWDGEHLIVATPARSRTARNLLGNGLVRLGLGPTRDLVLIDATVSRTTPATEVPADRADAFAAKAGFDPRKDSGYLYFHLAPHTIQAWREANELPNRRLMHHGTWLTHN